MVTPQELSALLRTVSCPEVARRVGLSAKTIYRYRYGKTSPTLEHVAAILAAVKAMTKKPAAVATPSVDHRIATADRRSVERPDWQGSEQRRSALPHPEG